MTIQQVLDSIHDRHILSNFILYALNVAIPFELAVNVHNQKLCNVNSFNINTVYSPVAWLNVCALLETSTTFGIQVDMVAVITTCYKIR